MDQAFLMRARRLLEQKQPARLDHAALIARIAALQAATPAARSAGTARAAERPVDDPEALIALLFAEPGWDDLGERRAGCFNRAVAKRGVNRP